MDCRFKLEQPWEYKIRDRGTSMAIMRKLSEVHRSTHEKGKVIAQVDYWIDQ